MNEGVLVELLEAIYALELSDESWLDQTLAATRRLCGPEHTYLGYFYDASSPDGFRPWNVRSLDLPTEVDESFRAAQLEIGPELLMATLGSQHVGSIRRTGMPYVAPLLSARERVGWGDIFSVNGLDPSGIGCLVTIGTREREFAPPARELGIYGRIAHHVATAFRCRRRLGISRVPRAAAGESENTRPDAVLDVEGRVVHAEGEAAGKTARERLRDAALSIRRLRTEDRGAGRTALDVWRPLVRARWTLVDSFEENGRRYVVAHENRALSAYTDLLTDRERQVVSEAALGFSNKEIAYALGISDSTVRVLIARAAARLGVRSRSELLSHPSVRELLAKRAWHDKPS